MVRLPVYGQKDGAVRQTVTLANGPACKLSIGYIYSVVDIPRAVKAVQYGKVRRLEPELIEAQLTATTAELFQQTSIADLDGEFEDRFERTLFDQANKTYDDGTKLMHAYIESFECTDRDAASALEIALCWCML